MPTKNENTLRLNDAELYIQREDGTFDKVANCWITDADLGMPAEEASKAAPYVNINSGETVTITGTFSLNSCRAIKKLLDEQRRFLEELKLLKKLFHILHHTKSHRIRKKVFRRILSVPAAQEALARFLASYEDEQEQEIAT